MRTEWCLIGGILLVTSIVTWGGAGLVIIPIGAFALGIVAGGMIAEVVRGGRRNE